MGANPFDFSDFGPPQSVPGPAPSSPSSSGPASFDPWAGQMPPRGPAPAAPGTVDRDAFGQLTTPPGPGALSTAGPPVMWFFVALGLAVVGAILAGVSALTGGNIWLALGGWLLAGPIAIGALAVYSRVDTRRRTEAIYSAPGWTTTFYWVVLAACLIGIAIGAWQIALWAGTL